MLGMPKMPLVMPKMLAGDARDAGDVSMLVLLRNSSKIALLQLSDSTGFDLWSCAWPLGIQSFNVLSSYQRAEWESNK